MDAARNVTATFTLIPGTGCTRTIGYWKEHRDEIASLLPIWLGTPLGQHSLEVDTTSEAIRILKKATTLNGILSLRGQLLGAMLNIASGADGSAVTMVIADADVFLAAHDPSEWRELLTPAKQEVNGWVEELGEFNTGVIGPGSC
jgi:hypothetical protein